MLRLSILILLQLTYTRCTTKQYVTYYWKTTSVTDKVYDYWNHGPIFIPGFENVYPKTTKTLDTSPPWLTRSLATYPIILTTNYELENKETQPSSIQTTNALNEDTETTTHSTINLNTTKRVRTTTTATTESPVTEIVIEPNPDEVTLIETDATKRTKQPQFSFEEAPIDGSIPFSAFMRKIMRALAAKHYSELPPLVKPFASYTTELIADGDFNGLGTIVIATAKEWLKELEGLIKSPDKLHAKCYQAYNMLSNRHTALDEDANKLLNFLDDTYDEHEEGIMLFILQETTNFPNSNATAEEIANSFVNNVFVNPWNRINGTSTQDTLVKMLTAAVDKKTATRLYASNTNRKKRSSFDKDDVIKSRTELDDFKEHNYKAVRSNTKNIHTYIDKHDPHASNRKNKFRNELDKLTENNYKAVRSNMENLDTYIDKLDLYHSSDTSAHEYEMKVNYDESDIIRALKVKPFGNATENKKNQTRVLRTNTDNDDESDRESEDYKKPADYGQKHKGTNHIKDLFNKFEKFLIPKSSVTPKDSSMYFRGDGQKYPNFEHNTVFVPSRFLVTKLISKPFSYDGVTKYHKKRHKMPRIHYSSAAPIKASGDTRSKFHSEKNNQIKNGRDTHFKYIANFHGPKEYYSYLQPITEPKNKPLAKLLESKPVGSDTEGLETALKYITLNTKPLNNQITKNTLSAAEIISKTGKRLRTGEMKGPRVQKSLKEITKHNANEQKLTAILADESDDTDIYVEHSYESLDNPNTIKMKYERLKHKYIILKQLSEQILLQNTFNTKQKQGPSGKNGSLSKNVNEKNGTSNSEEFYHRIRETRTKGPKKIRFNHLNLFLNDYNGKIEIESDIQEPQLRSADYQNIMRKSFSLNTTTYNSDNVTETDYRDAEKELKQNIYDALRHTDFVNYNASRRSDDVNIGVKAGSHETDLEAVLKTNIYKAVKTLLKT